MEQQSFSGSPRRAGMAARVVGAVLLVALPCVAAAVLIAGRVNDPARAELAATEASESSASSTTQTQSAAAAPDAHAVLAALLPSVAADAAYQPDGEPEFYDRETVFDKINGGAPPYLDLGLRELMTQAYTSSAPDLSDCELYVYDMTTADGARAIFEQQRSAAAQPFEIGDGGYRVGATVFFRKASYYAIVLNADSGAAAEAFSQQLAQALAERIGRL